MLWPPWSTRFALPRPRSNISQYGPQPRLVRNYGWPYLKLTIPRDVEDFPQGDNGKKKKQQQQQQNRGTLKILLLISQCGPVNPNLQSQRKSLSLCAHIPSFWQDLSLHPHFITLTNNRAGFWSSRCAKSTDMSSGLSRKFSSSDSKSRMQPLKPALTPVLWKLKEKGKHLLLKVIRKKIFT